MPCLFFHSLLFPIFGYLIIRWLSPKIYKTKICPIFLLRKLYLKFIVNYHPNILTYSQVFVLETSFLSILLVSFFFLSLICRYCLVLFIVFVFVCY